MLSIWGQFMKLNLDYLNMPIDFSHYQGEVCKIHNVLHDENSPYKDFLGWIDLPNREIDEYDKIINYRDNIREQSDALVVVGVGGSSLGAKAVIEALSPLSEIYFIGNNLSDSSIKSLFERLKDKKFSINIISKSGSTIETILASQILIEYMKEYFSDYRDRIYITTDLNKGHLRDYALKYNLKTLSFPRDIGGRYSVLTSALLPIATAGIDIVSLLEGAKAQWQRSITSDLSQNISYRYAAVRKFMAENDKAIELFVTYEPMMECFQKWWVQLFAESEGKEGRGIFPSYASFSEDLHSLGQLIQEGTKNIFETVISVETPQSTIEVPKIDEAFESLIGLNGMLLETINREIFLSTLSAHSEARVPNIVVEIPSLDAYHMGEMIYFFLLSVAMSAMLIGVNPFNQPGVEVYKSKFRKFWGN